MTKVLITGAGGFVGTHLLRALSLQPDTEVYANVYSPTSNITGLVAPDHIISGDLTDFAFAQKLIQISQPDVVYHLAALSVVHSSDAQATAVMNGNTTISYNVLEAVKQFAPSARFIAISSGNIYGAVQDASRPIDESTPIRPLNPYAVSKLTQEMLALQYYLAYDLDVVILRPFNHTGVGQTKDFVIPKLAEQFSNIEKGLEDPVVEVGNTDTVRDFTDVADMVNAYILAAKYGVKGEIYNIGTGVGHPVSEILEILQTLSKVKVEIKVKESLVRKADVKVLVADATKFRQISTWSPKISLEKTISDILNYYRG